MKSVGKLDNDNSDISRHCEKHFSDIFRLLFLFCLQRNFAYLGYALDKLRNRFAEFFFNFLICELCVLNGIVKNGGNYRCTVHSETCQNSRNAQRMHYIRLARKALLPVMG